MQGIKTHHDHYLNYAKLFFIAQKLAGVTNEIVQPIEYVGLLVTPLLVTPEKIFIALGG